MDEATTTISESEVGEGGDDVGFPQPPDHAFPMRAANVVYWPVESELSASQAPVGLEQTTRRDGRMRFRVEGWILETSRDWRFSDAIEARKFFDRAARDRARLASLSCDRILLALVTTDQEFWFWILTPEHQTLRDLLAAAPSDNARCAAMCLYGEAIVETLVTSRTTGLALDADARNFAVIDGRLVYVEGVVEATTEPRAAAAMLACIKQFGHEAELANDYVSSLERQLRCRLSRREIAELGLVRELEGVEVETAIERVARMRLVRGLSEYLEEVGSGNP